MHVIVAVKQQVRAAGAAVGTWVNLGLAEQRRLAPDEAEAAFREALRRDPALVIAWQKLAGLLEDTGRHVEALDCHRQALRLQPGDLRSLSDALLLRRYLADWDPTVGPHPAEVVAAWRLANRSDASPMLLLALPGEIERCPTAAVSALLERIRVPRFTVEPPVKVLAEVPLKVTLLASSSTTVLQDPDPPMTPLRFTEPEPLP